MRLHITYDTKSMELEGGNDEVHGTIAKILRLKFGDLPIILTETDLPILEGMDYTYMVLKNLDCVTLFTAIRDKIKKNHRILIELKPGK